MVANLIGVDNVDNLVLGGSVDKLDNLVLGCPTCPQIFWFELSARGEKQGFVDKLDNVDNPF